MKTTIRLVAFAMTLAILSSAAQINADEPKEKKKQSDVLDGPGLVKLLQGMGYKTTEVNDSKDGIIGASITYEGKKFDYSMRVTLSGNGQWVWVNTWMPKIPMPNIPAEKMRGLLQLNETLGGPSYYSHFEKTNQFRATSTVPNRKVDAALMKYVFTDLDALINAGEKHWNPKMWAVPVKQEKKKEEDKK